jgi:hypothetical protein
MIPFLTTTSIVQCPHLGMVVLITSNTQALVEGAPILLQPEEHVIVGCIFAPGGVAMPCVKVRWLTGTTQSLILNVPALLLTSVGLCFNALEVPQGTALVMHTQSRAMGV